MNLSSLTKDSSGLVTEVSRWARSSTAATTRREAITSAKVVDVNHAHTVKSRTATARLRVATRPERSHPSRMLLEAPMTRPTSSPGGVRSTRIIFGILFLDQSAPPRAPPVTVVDRRRGCRRESAVTSRSGASAASRPRVVECELCGTRLRRNDEPDALEVGADSLLPVARHDCIPRRRRKNLVFDLRGCSTTMGLKAAMGSAQIVLTNDLDLDARKAFIAATYALIQSESHGGSPVEVDCVAVESFGPVDETVIGMLVTLGAGFATQRGACRVGLARAKPMRAQFEAAGIVDFFDWEQ